MLKIDPKNVLEVAKILKNGGVAALPTETVYGLAASLDSRTGINRLMVIKDRGIDSGKVFTLVPEKKSDFAVYAETRNAEDLIEKYVPGQITLILPKNTSFRHFYYDNFEEIGLRIPDFELFQKLLPLSGPLLLTSANRRDRPTLRSIAEIEQEFTDVDAAVDQDCGHQLASTIVRIKTDGSRQVVRQGALVVEC